MSVWPGTRRSERWRANAMKIIVFTTTMNRLTLKPVLMNSARPADVWNELFASQLRKRGAVAGRDKGEEVFVFCLIVSESGVLLINSGRTGCQRSTSGSSVLSGESADGSRRSLGTYGRGRGGCGTIIAGCIWTRPELELPGSSHCEKDGTPDCTPKSSSASECSSIESSVFCTVRLSSSSSK